jgi:hypothetical protein
LGIWGWVDGDRRYRGGHLSERRDLQCNGRCR